MDEAKGNVPSFGYCYVVPQYFVPRFEGKILTLLETLGLKESQEKAVKDILRDTLWRSFNDEAIYVGEKTHTKIVNKYRELKANAKDTPIPMVEIVE